MSNPEVKIRLSLDGAGQVQSGVDLTAEKVLKLEKASADLAAAQARVDAATTKAAAAQAAYAKDAADSSTAASKLTELQNRSASAAAAMQQAAVGAKAAEASLKGLQAQTQAAGQQMKLSGNQVAQVSAQLQDFFVQIQGGGAPLTAFLQQGSQMSAVFGGMGNAARAMLSLLTPAVVGVGALAGAAVGLGIAYNKGDQEGREFNKTLILTGNAAGVSAAQMMNMAAAVRGMGAGTQGRAAEILNQMAGSARVGAENLQRFTAAAVLMERVGGPAAEEMAKAFVDLGRAPLEAAKKLDDATNFLTVSTYKQVKALEEQGRTAEAAKVAQEAYSKAMEDRAPKLLENLGLIERAWRTVGQEAKDAWDRMLDVGREDTAETLRKKLADVYAKSYGAKPDSVAGAAFARQMAEIEQQIAAAEKKEALAAKEADSEAKKLALKRESMAWDVEAGKYLSDRVRMEKELEATRTRGQALVEAGLLNEKDYRTQLLAIREKYADKKADTAASKELEDRRRLLAELSGVTASYEEDLARLSKIRDAGNISEERYIELVRELMAKQPIIKKQLDAQAEATKAQAKAIEEVEKAYQRQVEAAQRAAESVAADVTRLQEEQQAGYLAAEMHITLAQAIQRVTLARLAEQQAAARGAGEQEKVDAIGREIEARQKLLALVEGKDATAALMQQMDQRKQAVESILSSVDSTAQRVWTDVANGGEDAFKRVGNTIKAAVLDLLYQLTIKKWVIGITANVLGVGGGTAGTASSAIGTATNGLNLFNAGATAASMWGSSAAYGAAIGTTNIAAGSQAAMLAAQTSVFGAEGAAMTAAAAGNAAGSSIMSSIATAAPYVAGVLAVYALAKAMDNSGTEHTGGSSAFSATSGLSTGAGLYGVGSKAGAYSTQTEQLTTQLTQSIVGILDATASTFGQQAGYSAAAAFADDTSKDGAWGALAIKIGDKMVAGFGVEGNGKWPGRGFADGQAGNEQYLAAVSADVRKALDAVGLPAWATSMLDKLGGAPSLDTLSQTVAQINAIQKALVSLGSALPELANLTDSTVQSLLASFGSVDALSAAASSFYENFVPEAERRAATLAQIGDELGKVGITTLPTTREAYRALALAQDKNTEAGLAAYTALLKLNGAFASVVPATEAATAAVDNMAEQMAENGQRVLKQLTQRSGDLMVDLLGAKGDTSGAAALRRQIDLASLFEGISAADSEAAAALYDYNKALQDQIDTARKAASEAQAEEQRKAAVASERYGLETQLLQAQGDTAALRERELAALDPANRAFKEMLYALEDQAAEASKAAAALQSVNSALSSLDSNRTNLQVELLNAQGKSAEAAALKRASDLAGLTAGMNEADAARVAAAYDRNVALQKEIDQTRAAQQAAEAIARAQEQAAETAARAAEQLKGAWQSASDTLFSEAAKIRGLTTADSPASLAAAQANFAVATGQARAGDQDAVKKLPELARLVVELGKNQAGSQLELDRLRAAVAASLESTGNSLAGTYGLTIPKMATGTNYVPRDMLAFLHEGESVQPRQYNPAAGGGADVARLVEEMQALREQVARLEATSGRTASATERSRDVLINVTENGKAMQVETAS